MQPDPLNTIWPRIVADLRDAVGDSDYEVWLSGLRVGSFDGRAIVITVPAQTLAWVTDRFTRVLEASVWKIVGDDVALTLTATGAAREQPVGRAPVAAPASAPLNPKLSFDQFVLGSGNRFAHAAALAVAENPGTAYNPLFVCGPPGVGKTHLLHSVADYLQRNEPSIRVRLTTAEAFVNEFVAAVRLGGIDTFKARYRANDVLLVDDVQFLMAKTKTEEEFFHTFNALRDAGAQVMLTSDRTPRDLDGLHQRLRDRFESGLVAEIGAPDMATRIAVLRKRADHDGLPMPAPDVLESIAERVQTNLRQLEGALIRVVAFASLTGRVLDRSLAAEVLENLFPASAPQPGDNRVTIESVQEATCQAFGITRDELLSSSRASRVAWPRQVAMYLAREHTGETLPAIGAGFGGRGHTTVMHACKRTAERVAEDPEASTIVSELSTSLSTVMDDRSD